mmetsp:Transcript_58226/g.189799  ORF Transcript_58226/g.189799 Transcript_58226/m.189799 type:complete len:345 (-) Transcript_58226:124-1158(-)
MSKAKGSKKVEQDWQTVETERIADVIRELSKKVPGQVAPYVKQAAPHLAQAVVLMMVAMPYIVQFCSTVKGFVQAMPEKVVYASLGFAVCFFGGVFPATIAAVEAFQMAGGEEAKQCIKMLYQEAKKVQEANAEDESKDADKNGKADAKEIPPQELILRKAQLVLRTVEPETISHGIVGLYTGWIAVMAVLRHKFAKTVTLGERIGGAIYEPLKRFEPAVEELVPEEYRKWVPVAVRWTCKIFAMSIAWWIQRVISAIHSAIKGGLLFGHYLVEFLHEKKIINFTPEQAYLDEAIGWGVALAGLLFQFSWGFHLPFPLNLLLLPVQFVEGFITWSVNSGAEVAL